MSAKKIKMWTDLILYQRLIGVGKILFGLSLVFTPTWPFRGDLYMLNPNLPGVYGAIHIAFGFGMLVYSRHLTRPGFILLTSPLLFHLMYNGTDTVRRYWDTSLPLAILYFGFAVMIVFLHHITIKIESQ